jgi:carbonic anhydrase/acetyltransferase-like protein (isoleucine patch superfamily)
VWEKLWFFLIQNELEDWIRLIQFSHGLVLIRADSRFFSGILHPHLLGDCRPNLFCPLFAVQLPENAPLRGGINRIVVGHHSNIQDNAVLHLADNFGCIVGIWVTVGHSAIVHACTVGDEVLVGMGAVILDGAVIGRQSLIGARALVTQGMKIPPGSLVLGAPAKVVRRLSKEERAGLKWWAQKYMDNDAYCLKHKINVGGPLPD